MANERTFLAWIRTSIGIMAFGFVVEKFALFVRQFSYFLEQGRGGAKAVQPFAQASPKTGLSSLIGMILVGLGAVMAVLAFVRYKKVERQIDDDTYQPSVILDALLALAVVAAGIFLLLYLVHSI
jgi:uncharacterized membrane protein YidH (DUF202 family)